MKYLETECVELKRNLNDTFEKEVVSFLNSHDGYIYLGIEDNGEICGVNKLDENLKKISDIISTSITPNPQELIKVKAILEKDKFIIEISVKKGNSLYYINKYGRSSRGCYIRVGTSCRSMTEEQIEKKYIETLNIPKPTMKETLSPRIDLTFNEFKKLLIIKNIHYNELSFEENFHLKSKDNEYNYIAYLLSDQNSTSIKVCRFKGLTKAEFISRKEFEEGCILRQMEQAYEYTINVLNLIQTDVSGGKNRIDTPLFDSESFKEAWYNAVCHNLWIEKVPPAIYGFEDRIEIISHGLLREDLSKDDFYNGVSKPVNEEFADIFLKLHYMEQSGKGTSIIVKKYGKSAFKFGTSFIECIMQFNIIDKNNYYRMIGKDLQKNDTVNCGANCGVKLNNTEKLILKLIEEDSSITIKEIAVKLGKTASTIEKAIRRLKNEKNILQRTGSDKSGFWKVIKNNFLIKKQEQSKHTKNDCQNSHVNCDVNYGVNYSVKLNSTEKLIIQLIQEDSSITAKQIAEKLKKTISTIEKAISRLKNEKNMLERIGSDKAGYWKITKPNI